MSNSANNAPDIDKEQALSNAEIRGAKYNANGGIDCEVNHPLHGWIPFTASPNDGVAYSSAIFELAKKQKPKKIAAPVIPLKDAKATAQREVHRIATQIRGQLAGTTDPAKLAEYADKANNAQSVIDGTASDDIVAKAASEASSLGLGNAEAVAKVWLEKAAELRAARSRLNTNERGAIAAINAAKSAKAIDAYLANAMGELTKGLDDG